MTLSFLRRIYNALYGGEDYDISNNFIINGNVITHIYCNNG